MKLPKLHRKNKFDSYTDLIREGICLPLLREERGVGSSQEWLELCKEITDYVADTVKYGSSEGDGWHISIPKRLTEKFEIFSDLDIEVTVTDLGEEAKTQSGGGKYMVQSNQIVTSSGKFWMPSLIRLQGFSNGRSLVRQSIYNSLIHELNHAFEHYSRLSKIYNVPEKDYDGVLNQTKALNLLQHELGLKDRDTFWWIIYRLHSTTELDALIAGVYGELAGKSSLRVDCKKDIKNLSAYVVWKACTDTLDYIVDHEHDSHVLDVFDTVYDTFRDPDFREVLAPICPVSNPKNVSRNGFIKAFIEKTKRRLDQLLRGIYRTASYYYDSQEKEVKPLTIDKKEEIRRYLNKREDGPRRASEIFNEENLFNSQEKLLSLDNDNNKNINKELQEKLDIIHTWALGAIGLRYDGKQENDFSETVLMHINETFRSGMNSLRVYDLVRAKQGGPDWKVYWTTSDGYIEDSDIPNLIENADRIQALLYRDMIDKTCEMTQDSARVRELDRNIYNSRNRTYIANGEKPSYDELNEVGYVDDDFDLDKEAKRAAQEIYSLVRSTKPTYVPEGFDDFEADLNQFKDEYSIRGDDSGTYVVEKVLNLTPLGEIGDDTYDLHPSSLEWRYYQGSTGPGDWTLMIANSEEDFYESFWVLEDDWIGLFSDSPEAAIQYLSAIRDYVKSHPTNKKGLNEVESTEDVYVKSDQEIKDQLNKIHVFADRAKTLEVFEDDNTREEIVLHIGETFENENGYSLEVRDLVRTRPLNHSSWTIGWETDEDFVFEPEIKGFYKQCQEEGDENWLEIYNFLIDKTLEHIDKA